MQKYMIMNNINKSIIKWMLILLPALGFHYEAAAQCNIQISGAVCAGQPTTFTVNSPGATNVNWNFGGTLVNNQFSAAHVFPNPGTYSVTVNLTTATGQPCTNTINVTVLEKPKVAWTPVTPVVQCFEGNEFCIEDNSTAATGSTLKRSTIIIASTNITRQNPVNPEQVCVKTADPQGGFYDLSFEVEDANGCIDNIDYLDAFEVKPSLFLSFTSDQPKGCDSVLMTVTNTSLIDSGAIASFEWDFGDGTKDNTTWWPTVQHWYYTEGPDNGNFTTTLTVTDTTGCTEKFVFNSSATNVIDILEIVNRDSTCMSDNTISFQLNAPMPPGVNQFLWTFGDPDTGPDNFDFRNPTSTEHAYSKPGPFLVSYMYMHPICGTRTLYKQVSIIGPASSIPGPDIPINQRYQCTPERRVQFPNASAFFHNDVNIADDASGFLDSVLYYVNNGDTISFGPKDETKLETKSDSFMVIVGTDTSYSVTKSYYYINNNNDTIIVDFLDLKGKDFGWHYYFDSTSLIIRQENLDLRGNYGTYECVMRLWDFADNYSPRCTTDSRPIYPQSPMFNNLHFSPDPVTGLYPKNTYDQNGSWINCRFSHDSLPFHYFPSWDSIYHYDFFLPNQPFSYSYYDPLDQKCYQRQVYSSEQPLHRELFFIEEPRCNMVSLYHEDTCHAFKCESKTETPICILPPDATGMFKDGTMCFGGPPTYGIIFVLSGTKPGITMDFAAINPDTALNPNNWISFLPGGLTGTPQAPSPIMPYPISGPYPNRLLHFYPNPGTIADDSTGYAHVGLIVGNGGCFDTVYYNKFLKFPILDNAVEVLIPEEPLPGWLNVYRLCKGDSIIMRPTLDNVTVVTDVDEIVYRLSRIAPDNNADSRFNDYHYIYYENYQWFQQVPGESYLSNRLTRSVNRIRGEKRDTILVESFEIGRVYKYTMRADVSQVREILTSLFDNIGFNLSRLSEEEIAEILAAKCVDTTGLGRFITFDYSRDSFESFHYRDRSITPLDTNIIALLDSLNTGDSLFPSYKFMAEENGIFDLVYQARSRIGGCITQNGYRVLIGFYHKFEVSDSIICRETPITLTPYFRYFHVDPNRPNPPPPPWLDLRDFWTDREAQAGDSGIEGYTSWDWSLQDDDPSDSNTIFGAHPYGWIGYNTDNFDGGGPEAGRVYYNDSGFYTMRIAAQDSSGCRDTIYQNIYATRAVAKFDLDNQLTACVNIVDLFDSSYIFDPCQKAFNKDCDKIIEWKIDWGDGKQPAFFNRNNYPPFFNRKISHNYTRNGAFSVTMVINTELGCTDTFVYELVIDGPIPEFFVMGDTSICVGDSVQLMNISGNVTTGSQWIWIFGDSYAKSEDIITREDSFWHIYRKPGTFDIYLSMFDSVKSTWCGFTYPDTINGSQPRVTITVHKRDSFETIADKYVICPGEFINFTVQGIDSGFDNYIAFNWNFDGILNPPDPAKQRTTTGSDMHRTSFQYTEKGIYRILVEGVHDSLYPDRCPFYDTIFIRVDDVVADFEIDSSKSPEFCFTNTSTGSVKHSWGFYHEDDITETGGDFEKDIESDDIPICRNYAELIGQFYVCLVAESEFGCLDTICKTVSNFRSIQVPNVFTPRSGGGGDGFNDMFKIPIMGHDLFEISIRNRWGDVVFKSDNSDIHWNGQVNNTGVNCPDGTYFYMLKYRFKGIDEIIETNGIVQLIWEK
jgi:gliding motility-associated-like protein